MNKIKLAFLRSFCLTGRMFLGVCLFLAFVSGRALADDVDSWYEFEDAEQTTITGVTLAGIAHIISESSLIIPSQVTNVASDAFAMIPMYNATLSELVIDGGNPVFEIDGNENALASVSGTLENIDMGSGMSVANMETLLTGLGAGNNLAEILISNNPMPNVQWTSEIMKSILPNSVRVIMPAALVGNQTFGNATVYGRFVIPEGISLSTFCGTQTFRDTDTGSNLLFYIPTEVQTDITTNEKRIFIQRVHFVTPNQGVLMHNETSTDELEGRESTRYNQDLGRYDQNMLVGVTTPTTIGRTETKGGVEYTNMILYNGSFYRTSGGTLGANRAYLQVKTSELEGLTGNAKLSVMFADDEPTGISLTPTPSNLSPSLPQGEGAIYDLQGRKVSTSHLSPSGGSRRGLLN